jgi:DNA adenine methylase
MKGPISYYGGKAMLAGRIVKMIPSHTTYCEPFFGGGAVYWAKDRSSAEIVNDVNGELVNLYRQIQTNCKELQREIQGTPHSRNKHKDAWVIYQNPHLFTEVKRAWAVWVLANMGFSSQLSGSFGTSVKNNAQPRKIANKRVTFGEPFRDRLSLTTIECRDAVQVIEQYDTPETFHYCDPPYHNSDCGPYSGYTEADFERLLKALSNAKGKFLLSSYPSEILDRYIEQNGWRQIRISGTVSVARKKANKKGKTECLTSNY